MAKKIQYTDLVKFDLEQMKNFKTIIYRLDELDKELFENFGIHIKDLDSVKDKFLHPIK